MIEIAERDRESGVYFVVDDDGVLIVPRFRDAVHLSHESFNKIAVTVAKYRSLAGKEPQS